MSGGTFQAATKNHSAFRCRFGNDRASADQYPRTRVFYYAGSLKEQQDGAINLPLLSY